MRWHLPRIAFLSDPEVLLAPTLFDLELVLDLETAEEARVYSSSSKWSDSSKEASLASWMDWRVWLLCFLTKRSLAVCASNSSRVEACETRPLAFGGLVFLRCFESFTFRPVDSVDLPEESEESRRAHIGTGTTSSWHNWPGWLGKQRRGGSSSGTKLSAGASSFLGKEGWKILRRREWTSCRIAPWEDWESSRLVILHCTSFIHHLTSWRPCSSSSLNVLKCSSKFGCLCTMAPVSKGCSLSRQEYIARSKVEETWPSFKISFEQNASSDQQACASKVWPLPSKLGYLCITRMSVNLRPLCFSWPMLALKSGFKNDQNVFSYCLQFVFNLSSICLQFVFNLFSICLHGSCFNCWPDFLRLSTFLRNVYFLQEDISLRIDHLGMAKSTSLPGVNLLITCRLCHSFAEQEPLTPNLVLMAEVLVSSVAVFEPIRCPNPLPIWASKLKRGRELQWESTKKTSIEKKWKLSLLTFGVLHCWNPEELAKTSSGLRHFLGLRQGRFLQRPCDVAPALPAAQIGIRRPGASWVWPQASDAEVDPVIQKCEICVHAYCTYVLTGEGGKESQL